MAVVKEIFSAYNNNELPREGGYIISSFFDANSTYTRYEITSYNNVKSIRSGDEGLTFQADGKKLWIMVEPANYPKKHTEPAYRDDLHKIPYRFKELEKYDTKRRDSVFIGREPVISYGSFTVLRTTGNNFSYVFYDTDDLQEVIRKFFSDTLWKDCNVPKADAERITKHLQEIFTDFINYKVN